MNREIKFRVWDIKQHRFLTSQDGVNYELESTYEESKELERGRGIGFVCIGWAIQRKNRYIVQQYTKLKDKNDKEIYEGDILSYGPSYRPYVVEYNDRIGAFTGGMFRFNGEGMSIRTSALELIGNVFETPELLK